MRSIWHCKSSLTSASTRSHPTALLLRGIIAFRREYVTAFRANIFTNVSFPEHDLWRKRAATQTVPNRFRKFSFTILKRSFRLLNLFLSFIGLLTLRKIILDRFKKV